jgi:hypothetical protein
MIRNTVISQVCDAVSEASGWIVDQSFFSIIAATINFEMPSHSLQKFQDALPEKGFKAHIGASVKLHNATDGLQLALA